jgi:hypothetical protein
MQARALENVVVRLVEPYVGKTSNVSMDYFCTSLALANKLLANKTRSGQGSKQGKPFKKMTCPP